MTESLAERHGGGRFATLIDQDGNPPCDPADDCEVCKCFLPRQPDESLQEWGQRLRTGINPNANRRAP